MKLQPHARTVDALLQSKGYTLHDFIADRRDENKGYEAIARELDDFTDGVVTVSYKTIERWARRLGLEEDAA